MILQHGKRHHRIDCALCFAGVIAKGDDLEKVEGQAEANALQADFKRLTVSQGRKVWLCFDCRKALREELVKP